MIDLDPLRLRALHSFALESVLSQRDPAVVVALVSRLRTVRHLVAALADGKATTTILHDTASGHAYVRLEVLGDDGRWHGLCHPPAGLLGLDEAELLAVVTAEAAMRGEEPERLHDLDPRPDDGPGFVVDDF